MAYITYIFGLIGLFVRQAFEFFVESLLHASAVLLMVPRYSTV